MDNEGTSNPLWRWMLNLKEHERRRRAHGGHGHSGAVVFFLAGEESKLRRDNLRVGVAEERPLGHQSEWVSKDGTGE